MNIEEEYENNYSKKFCHEFIHSSTKKYIFGRNEFSKSIASIIKVDGFIDEFTDDIEYEGKPIIAIEDIPNESLVVSSVVVGKPLIAEKKMKKFQFKSLDYFSFYRDSGLKLQGIDFWDGFEEDFTLNRLKYEWIYNQLSDSISKNQFHHLINFRLTYDLNHMRGFNAIEDKQYFEDFLELGNDESFADIGAFDGYTTEEFIKRCPNYKNVYLFEPDNKNIEKAQSKLKKYLHIHYFQLGLSDKKQTLRFNACGSSSNINENGNLVIEVDKLDNIIHSPITFLKMDIEGGEAMAIEGAKNTIRTYHPKLAISVYHKADDLWRIPAQILDIRNDYSIYLRHYTEGFAETVMFFIPKKKKYI